MPKMDLIPHLFRTEYSKLVAVLTKSFGLAQMDVAEDMASETFLLALNTWPYKGVPANPQAWLYTVARNKVKNHIIRNDIFSTKVAKNIVVDHPIDEIDIDFSEKHIADSQLQMLFTLCHPAISTESQICLALRTLCGLGLNEIADALLSKPETIHKRLQRARQKLYAEGITIEMPPTQYIHERLETVLQTIYLLFSEGYYSESHEVIIRKDRCVEALNLTYLLLDNRQTNTHSTNALMSLLCFQASRLEARKGENEHLVLYKDQDRALWDKGLIEKGFYYLQQASQWPITSTYYLEASIAYWHTVNDSNPDKWCSMLKLYDALLSVYNSPIVALNRIWAFSKVHGSLAAIQEAKALNLPTNHFYFVLLAELNKSIDVHKTLVYLNKALHLCKTEMEKEMIAKRIEELQAV